MGSTSNSAYEYFKYVTSFIFIYFRNNFRWVLGWGRGFLGGPSTKNIETLN